MEQLHSEPQASRNQKPRRMVRRHKVATGGVSNANETRGKHKKTIGTPPDGGVAPCHGVGREPGDGKARLHIESPPFLSPQVPWALISFAALQGPRSPTARLPLPENCRPHSRAFEFGPLRGQGWGKQPGGCEKSFHYACVASRIGEPPCGATELRQGQANNSERRPC